jgi:hypothetical protein
LREFLVPLTNRAEGRWGHQADDFIGLFRQGVPRFGRSNGHGNDDARGLLLAKGRDGSAHAGAGGQAIVDQDHNPAANIGRRPRTTVRLLLLLEQRPL